jgi:hypothetical protein
LISSIQTFLFLIIANPVLGIKGMFLNYWIALLTTAFCANMLGLNISSSFNSAVTIYIVIPLLIIPMMVLSGAMFPFDKMNRQIGSVEKVPFIAELMPTRWTYEALMVTQFKDNRYSKVQYDKEKETYYSLQKKISEAEFNKIYRIKTLRDALETCLLEYKSGLNNHQSGDLINPYRQENQTDNLELLRNELTKIARFNDLPEFNYISELVQVKFNSNIADSLSAYFDILDKHYTQISNSASATRDRFHNLNQAKLKKLENEYYNYKLLEIVTKPYERKKILIHNNSLVQNTDMIYLDAYNRGFFKFRTHLYAPYKYIFGIKTDTFLFNINLVLLSTLFLFIILYYELPGRVVRLFENIKFRK